jgi:MFS family permease/AraC-like DNA-binding protein
MSQVPLTGAPPAGTSSSADAARIVRAGTYHRDVGREVVTGWHSHNLHQLEYALEGIIQVETATGRYLLPPQQAAWIPAGVEHSSTLTGVSAVSAFFAPAPSLPAGDQLRVLAVPPVMREMIRYAKRWPIGRTSVDPTADAFFGTLGNLVVEWLDYDRPLCLPTARDPLVSAVMDYTTEHLADVTLPGVCAAVGVSERTLRRAFLAATGMAWRRYLLESRLLTAMALLAEDNQNVLSIALTVGFQSVSAFTRAFGRYANETPTAYRRRVMASHAAAVQAEEWPAGLAERALRRWSYWGEIRLAAAAGPKKATYWPKVHRQARTRPLMIIRRSCRRPIQRGTAMTEISPAIDDSNEDIGRLTGASRFRLIVILVTMVLFSEVAVLQVSMIAIILPKLGEAFPASGSSTSWAITILGIVGGATLALTGKAGDLWGKKRTLLVCAVFFLVGTLLCAVTTSWAVFLLGRGIGGVAYGMAVVQYGLVRDLLPRRWIPIAVAFIGTGFGLASIIGPLVCGLLIDHFSWRSVFWFLVIYSLVMFVPFIILVPESKLRVHQRFDMVGAALLGAGVGLTLIYLSQGSTWGWGHIDCLGYLLGGLVGLVAFVWWERRTSDPMLEISLLVKPAVLILMALAFFVTGIQALLNVLLSYIFETPKPAALQGAIVAGAAAKQHVSASIVSQFLHFQGDIGYAQGYSVLQLAERVTIWSALFTMIFGPLGGWLARRIGARIPLIIGMVALVAGCALLIGWHSTWQEQDSIGLLIGIGSGFYFGANPNVVLDLVPASRQGVTVGMIQVFGSIGTSVVTALLISVLAAHPFQIAATVPGSTKAIVSTVPQVYTNGGFSMAYLLLGVIPAVIALVGAVALRQGRKPARGGAPEEAATAATATSALT